MKTLVILATGILMSIGTAGAALGQALTADKSDYAPGETATLTGSGFAAGEDVVVQVLHGDATPDSGADHETWAVVADENGEFVATWNVCTDDCVGATLRAVADGQASGLHAETTFTDSPKVPAQESK